MHIYITMDNTTTVQVKLSTKQRLEGLKITKGESMDSVINRLTVLAIDGEPLSKDEIRGIRQSLKEIEQGKTRPAGEVYKKLGI